MHLAQDAYVRLILVRLISTIYVVARCRMAIGNFGQPWCFTGRVLVGGSTGPELFDQNLWLSQWPWLETTCGCRASPGSDGLLQALSKLRPLQMAKGRPGNRAALLPGLILVQQLCSLRSRRCLFRSNSFPRCARAVVRAQLTVEGADVWGAGSDSACCGGADGFHVGPVP